MKAFEYFEKSHFRYPEDMKVIMNYLNQHGKLNIKAKTVERMYEDFSDEYYSAGWMSIVSSCGNIDKNLLIEFAHYLSKIDL